MDDGRIGDTEATVVDGPGVGERAELGRGDTLGRYIVLGPIGRDGMGMVYKAYDPDLDWHRPRPAGQLRESSGNELRVPEIDEWLVTELR